MMIECEVQQDGAWVSMGTSEAYGLPEDAVKRCAWCHGAVHLYPATKGGGASVPHFGHNKANPGCPHTIHPDAIG